jgi:hypothetical protein
MNIASLNPGHCFTEMSVSMLYLGVQRKEMLREVENYVALAPDSAIFPVSGTW